MVVHRFSYGLKNSRSVQSVRSAVFISVVIVTAWCGFSKTVTVFAWLFCWIAKTVHTIRTPDAMRKKMAITWWSVQTFIFGRLVAMYRYISRETHSGCHGTTPSRWIGSCSPSCPCDSHTAGHGILHGPRENVTRQSPRRSVTKGSGTGRTWGRTGFAVWCRITFRITRCFIPVYRQNIVENCVTISSRL